MKSIVLIFIMIGLFFSGCGSTTQSEKRVNTDEVILPFISNDTKILRAANKAVSPLAEYRLDGCSLNASTTFKDRQGEFDASAKNTPTLEENVLLNSGLHLDGSSYMRLPTMSVDYSEGFSFVAWVKFDKDAGSGKNWETIFSFGNDDSSKAYAQKHSSEIWLNRYYKSNKLYFAFTNGDRDNPCADVKTVEDVLTPGVMQHIAVTVDRENYPHIFVDGKEVETTLAWHNAGGTCSLPSSRRNLCYIGKPNDEWMGVDSDGGHRDHKDNNLLEATIDEIKIFNQAISADTIQNIYSNEKSGLNADGSERTMLSCGTPAPIPTPAPDVTIMIDGDVDDWRHISGVTRQGTSIKTYADDTYAYFLIQSTTIKNPTAIWFIDADNNPKTGHQAKEWHSSGADYAIGTAGKLYIAQTDDAQWIWDKTTLDTAPEFINKDGVIELKVRKSDFHLGNSYRVGARVFDDASQTSLLPERDFFEYTTTNTNHFATIKSILKKEGATYISVGDSTRADDPHYQNGEIFAKISAALGGGVHTILQATPGHTAKVWDSDNSQLSWKQTLEAIPDDGSTTVVNISLGINDMRYFADKNALKNNLLNGIQKILAKKPATHFMLTMPNRMVGVESEGYIAVYKELSQRFPMVNTEAIFASGDLSLYRDEDANEYGEEIRIHLSKEGQNRIANAVLAHIK